MKLIHDTSSVKATMKYLFALFSLVFVICAVAPSTNAQERVDRNVSFGMVSGLSFLMDIHYPQAPNGFGVVVIYGTAWHGPTGYDTGDLKERGASKYLLDAGYTVFAVNHRTIPLYHYTEFIADVKRAVRFIRYHADEYGIDSDKIGGFGSSSGGHLISMLATLDGLEDPDESDIVNSLSSKL